MFGLWRMPIARFEHRLASIEKLSHQVVERRNDFISIRDGQRAAGTKVVLHVNHNQCFLCFTCHDD